MPKNKGKGGKNRRRGKNENDDDKRELVFKEDGQEYAQVTKMLGNGRLEAQCFDGEKRLAHIRGKMRKKACSFLFFYWHLCLIRLLTNRSGSIKAISFFCPCVISRTIKRMSSSNTRRMRRAIVRCVSFIARFPDLLIFNTAVKAYGELPENAKINETDTFGEEDGECTFEFGDEGEVDIDDI
ncbi:hypothetical protein C0993_012175 [Termitomyces sp. T159_Od127]|nr:hypothetical protein C0993_012175 [Termitomyces sp. T159_Od127]